MLRSGRVNNHRQSLGSFLDGYSDNYHAILDATRNWMAMYNWLDDILRRCCAGAPLKMNAIADAKIKTDKIDATVLAHLVRLIWRLMPGLPERRRGSFASSFGSGCFTCGCARWLRTRP